MDALLTAADVARVPLVVLLGSPQYYSRFGFRPAKELGVIAPEPEWGDAFQARPGCVRRVCRRTVSVRVGLLVLVAPGVIPEHWRSRELHLLVGFVFSSSPGRRIVHGAASFHDHVDSVVGRPDPDHVGVRVDDGANRCD
jgi:hypothetical protein